MAWPPNVTQYSLITSAHINAVKNAIANWLGDVQAAGYRLINVGKILVNKNSDDSSDVVQVNGSVTATEFKGNIDFSYVQNIPVHNVKKFGAVGDGTTDDTSAIQSAINSATTAGVGILFFPAGTYRITSLLTINGRLVLAGAGMESTYIVQNSSTSSSLNFNLSGVSGTLTSQAGLRDLTICAGNKNSTTADGSSGTGLIISGANHGFVMERVAVKNHAYGIYILNSYDVKILNSYVWFAANIGIRIADSSDTLIENTWIRNLSATGSVSPYSNGLVIEGGNGIALNSSFVSHFHRGLLLFAPQNKSIFNVRINDCWFDSNIDCGVLLSTYDNTSLIQGVLLNDSYFINTGRVGAWGGGDDIEGRGILIDTYSGGPIRDVRIVGGAIRENGGQGVLLIGSGLNEFHMNGVSVANNGLAGVGGSQQGIYIGPNISNWSITNCRIGNFASTQGAVQTEGIYIANGSGDNYQIVGNNLNNASSAPLYNGATGTSRIIASNLPASVNL